MPDSVPMRLKLISSFPFTGTFIFEMNELIFWLIGILLAPYSVDFFIDKS